jgi:hypothetical protein
MLSKVMLDNFQPLAGVRVVSGATALPAAVLAAPRTPHIACSDMHTFVNGIEVHADVQPTGEVPSWLVHGVRRTIS